MLYQFCSLNLPLVSSERLLVMLRPCSDHFCINVLLIDCIDECFDRHYFLGKLRDLGLGIDCRVHLLSRPDIIIPFTYRRCVDSTWQLRLSTGDNSDSVRSFLRKWIDEMTNEILLGSNTFHNNTIDDLMRRAKGLFLWAKLLPSHRDCRALSPSERFTTMQNTNFLKGLGSLCNKLLDVLGRGFEK